MEREEEKKSRARVRLVGRALRELLPLRALRRTKTKSCVSFLRGKDGEEYLSVAVL